MPACNELTQCGNPRVIGELSQGIDSKQVRSVEGDFYPLVFFVWLVTADRPSLALFVLEKPKWFSPLEPPPLQPFFDYDGGSFRFIYGQVIGDKWSARLLSVFYLDDHRSLRSPRHKLFPPSTFIPCASQPHFETFGKKREHVEYGGFAAAVGAKENG